MTKTISSGVTLNNGVVMPWLGLGVWQGRPEDGAHVEHAVRTAIEAGYRSIDTAAAYRNEQGVGRAVRASGVPREEIFVTTKVDNANQGYDATLKAFDKSLDELGMDYIDLYLIHWPVSAHYMETWRAMEKLYAEGKVRAIGVSNFQIRHLDTLLAACSVVPAVNQVEYHPRLTQKELQGYCNGKGIQLVAWSPLMLGRLLEEPLVQELAGKYGRTGAQIVLRWDLQNGVVTIPKSAKAERIYENADIFGFELSLGDMERLDALNRNERSGMDPDKFEELWGLRN
ncbi:aldo/keto reductase [Paenibacillus lignilyticus]|uniref:Aldo/keto reductase n=1 Tax=Paenibacillus lignilyticus TaxID=1172615 RepID=A0ABS5CHM5_9BACL|nr:aldo/keto reductase [Paenibacillus lignilyticus]MBP3965317.1 aldo/keto reductase [Paenibacillus lignilyticus]